jgi:corrinoid protein of di/trimethylamine methyltransferase
MMSKVQEVAKAVEFGKVKVVADLVKEALAEGATAQEILNEGMIKAMAAVGEAFKNDEIFVPEMLMAARAMKAGVEVLTPHLKEVGAEPIGKVIIGTVAGDLHDIGKNLVAMMIEGAGFDVLDLGVDVPAEKFVEAINANPDAQILALSSLLTTTLPASKATIEAVVAAGLRDKVKIMVGGAPVTQEFADEVGADGYAEDAASAAELAKSLLN